MNEKIMKKTLMSCIAILLIAVLAITLTSFLNRPMTVDAAENLFKATLASDAGQLPDIEGGHRSDNDARDYLKNNYGAPEGGVLKITTGEQLYDFINNSSNAYRYAYLANDVGIAYSNGNGSVGENYYKTEKSSSAAVFTKVLDGNGYTVNLWAGTGYYEYAEESDNYFTYGSTTYRYTGLLMAINRGVVENLIIDYKSIHGSISAVTGQGENSGSREDGFTASDTAGDTGLFNRNGNFGAVGGIVAGMNGDGGVINNVRLNVNSNFKVIDYRSNDHGDTNKNFSFVGGIMGRAGRGSTLSNSHVNIAESAGIYAGTQGFNTGFNKQGRGLSVAGGLVGKIDQGAADGDIMKNAVVEYCAVTGSGTVKAYVAMGHVNTNNDGFRAYSGAAIGACINLAGRLDGVQDGGKESGTPHIVNKGQVKGIVSDWTGLCQNNYENRDNVTYGQLFGSVGSNVESSTMLFDLIEFRRGKGVDVSQEANISLDSFRSNVLLSWVGIYPKTEGGQVIVRLNNDAGSRYDLRIHAFADNSAANDASLLAEDLGTTDGKQYALSTNQTGNIIWKATFGSTERISLMTAMPTYAESKLVSSGTSGNYEYSFGSMTTIAFGNTNGDTTSRNYMGKSKVLNRPSVAAATGISLEGYRDSEWKILRNGVETSSDMSGTALPGTYSMNVQAEEDTYTPLGYYSDTQRVAAWPATSYKFTITEGELTYGSNTVVSDTWSKEAKFELVMASDDYFDSIRYVRNGSIVMDSADKFTKNANIASITITDSTGKNGMAYSFVAYAKDGDKDIVVARTKAADDKIVKIDNEKPEISDISYFVRNSAGHDTPIDERDLATWRTDRIVVRYNIIDTKSGIKFAPSSMNGQQGATIRNTKNNEDGSYDVEVILSRSDNFTITYTDNIGNTYDVELQANVDYMSAKPTLALSKIVYPSSDYGYSTQGARIRFNPTVGCSDWQLQYSWQKNSDGSDKWEDAMAQTADGLNTDSTYLIKGSKEQSFLINWNMGDAVRNISAAFKMRMVNVQGLYEDVPLSKGGVVTDNGFVGSFIINYKVAGIYVDNSLQAVKISGGKYDGRTIADVIANENFTDIQSFFNKVYDATDEFTGIAAFYIDVKYGEQERNNIKQFVEDNGVGILYTPAYIATPQDIDARINIELRYESANASDSVNLYATFAHDGAVAEQYDLFFADNENIEFNNSYTIVGDKLTSDKCKINAETKIFKYTKTITLEDDAIGLQNVYQYGETVPKTVDVNVGIKGVEVTIQLECEAQSIQPVGSYKCTGRVISDLGGNMEITVKEKDIEIEAKPVYVDIKMDGNDNILTSVSAGQSHEFTATYKDIDGKDQKANVQLTMGDEIVNNAAIYKKGTYSITVSIADKNYTVKDGYIDESGKIVNDGTYRFFFSIRQGRLPLTMNINVEEYTKDSIKYNPGVPADINSNLFNTSDLTFKYYQYLEGAKYNPDNHTIEGYYDRKQPMENAPYEIGIYHVEVSYAGNEAFFPETYMGDMVITKANTEFKFAAKASHAYELDDNKKAIARTFNPADAQTSVIVSHSGEVIWDFADLDASKITINYLNSATNKWEPIGDNALGAGWYTEIGEYSYKIEYAGDEHYNACASNVVLTITPAVFKGIMFDSIEGVYDGKNFVEDLIVNVPYSEAAVEYRYANKTYKSLSDIDIKDAGKYEITMTVKQSGYQDHVVTATINIKKAQISGITAVPVSAVYDGQKHDVTFNGFDIVGGKYVYSGFDVMITSMTTSQAGNLYAIDAGNYNGKVRISVPNHEDLILDTFMVIDKAEIKFSDARTGLPKRLPSGMDMREYFGAYTKDGANEETDTYLIYKDANGNIVKPDSNGILADGIYTVELDVGNNYYVNKKWDLIIGEINSSKLTAPAIAAVAVTAAVMIAAIITSVVVVNKRKKEDVIA